MMLLPVAVVVRDPAADSGIREKCCRKIVAGMASISAPVSGRTMRETAGDWLSIGQKFKWTNSVVETDAMDDGEDPSIWIHPVTEGFFSDWHTF